MCSKPFADFVSDTCLMMKAIASESSEKLMYSGG